MERWRLKLVQMLQHITKTNIAIAIISFCLGWYIANLTYQPLPHAQELNVTVIPQKPLVKSQEFNVTNVIYINKDELVKIISNLAHSCIKGSANNELILMQDNNTSRYSINGANVQDKKSHAEWKMTNEALCVEQNKTINKYIFIRPNEVILK